MTEATRCLEGQAKTSDCQDKSHATAPPINYQSSICWTREEITHDTTMLRTAGVKRRPLKRQPISGNTPGAITALLAASRMKRSAHKSRSQEATTGHAHFGACHLLAHPGPSCIGDRIAAHDNAAGAWLRPRLQASNQHRDGACVAIAQNARALPPGQDQLPALQHRAATPSACHAGRRPATRRCRKLDLLDLRLATFLRGGTSIRAPAGHKLHQSRSVKEHQRIRFPS